jgi:hypothetical protein
MRMLRILLLATLPAFTGACSDEPARPDPPAAVAAFAGDGQPGTVGEALPHPVVVRVTNADGDPLEGVEVVFGAEQGSGAPDQPTTRTGEDGLARMGWTLGETPGAQALFAAVPGLSPVRFTAEARAGAPARMRIEPDSGTLTAVGMELALATVYEDRFGNAAAPPPAGVTWTSLDSAVAAAGPGALPGQGRVTARGSGRARVTGTAGAVTDTVVVAVVQVAAAVTVTLQGSDTLPAGSSVQATATAVDANEHPIPDIAFTWTATNPQVARVDADGRVTAVGGGTVQVHASAAGGATGAVTVTVPGPGAPATEFRVRRFSAGGFTTCAIRDEDSRVYCWGSNHTGQAGFGAGAQASVPRAVSSLLSFQTISTSITADPQGQEVPRGHTCAVAADGSGWCWGLAAHGELGTGSLPDEQCTLAPGRTAPCSRTPRRVAGGITWLEIKVGATHTCGLATGGIVYCWGANEHGQVGVTSAACPAPGTGEPVPCATAPVRVPDMPAFTGITVSDGMTCGWNRQMWCWGIGGVRRPSDPDDPYVPFKVSRKYRHGCVLIALENSLQLPGGYLGCSGANESGQLGDASYSTKDHMQVSAGGHHTCIQRRISPAISCWGSNSDGQLLSHPASSTTSGVYVGEYATVDAGGRFTCGVRMGSPALWCWGDGTWGQLGDAGTADAREARMVRAP